MISADEVRHHLLSLGIRTRNWVRRAGWSLLGKLPTKGARTMRSADLLGPDDDTAHPGEALHPGARETYALHLTGDLVIEPNYGWIIAGRTRIVEPSMPYHVWSSVAPNLLAKPPITAALRAPGGSAGAVVSLRIAWEDNYYHFFNDVLGRLRLIDSIVPPEVPVVLSEAMTIRPYVRAAIDRGAFGNRQVIEQPTQAPLTCSEVYLVDKRSGDRRDWDYFLDRLDDRPPGDGSRHVLLVRSPARGRALVNDREVRDICRDRGFEVVDTDKWSLEDQIDLFRDTSHVVGVHGAGLTNIAFRRGGALRLLELIPPGPFPLGFNAVHHDETDYEALSRYFGFDYSSLTGSIDGRIYKRNQNFHVETVALSKALDALDSSGPDGPPGNPTTRPHTP